MTLQAEALAFLETMAEHHIELRAEGGHILFRPAGLVTADDREQLLVLKPQLLSLLRPWTNELGLLAMCAYLPPEDAQDLQEERAAILEFEAGFTRADAEQISGLCRAKSQR